jgi:phage portal protein BeeE
MPLNDDKRQEIRDKWRSTYGNRYGRSHDIGILDSNVDFQQTGSKLDELQSQTLRSVAESRICMVFGVPPLIVYAYVGLLRATYSNLGEAWRGFWDATMSPMFKELKDFWTWSLLTEFEDESDIRSERVRLAYDMSTVAALQEDVDAIQKRSEQAWRAGGISRAEYRQALSQPSDPSDAFYLLPAGAVVVPVGSVPAPAAAPAPAKHAQKTRTRGSVQLTERRIERAMQTYLAREYERAAQAVA